MNLQKRLSPSVASASLGKPGSLEETLTVLLQTKQIGAFPDLRLDTFQPFNEPRRSITGVIIKAWRASGLTICNTSIHHCRPCSQGCRTGGARHSCLRVLLLVEGSVVGTDCDLIHLKQATEQEGETKSPDIGQKQQGLDETRPVDSARRFPQRNNHPF